MAITSYPMWIAMVPRGMRQEKVRFLDNFGDLIKFPENEPQPISLDDSRFDDWPMHLIVPELINFKKNARLALEHFAEAQKPRRMIVRMSLAAIARLIAENDLPMVPGTAHLPDCISFVL
jgi:hypothetical protein